MRIQTRMKDLASGKPVPDGVHRFKVVKMEENIFKDGEGPWGFKARFKCIASDQPGAENRNVFENFLLVDEDAGDLHAASFRFGQCYMAIAGEDAEIDADSVEDVKDQFRTLAESMVDGEFTAETAIQPSTLEGMSDQARVEKYL